MREKNKYMMKLLYETIDPLNLKPTHSINLAFL